VTEASAAAAVEANGYPASATPTLIPGGGAARMQPLLIAALCVIV
jgi:hypothetical protein